MFGLLLLIALGVWVLFFRPSVEDVSKAQTKVSGKLDSLWGIARESLKEKKYLRAEKALLTILRVDERNATAYNRLGILYAKQQSFQDAIECFEIAQSLEPSPSSLHNVGLIYYETGRYDKAALAFEQAIAMDDDLAARHIAYAKVQEKLGNTKKMISSLEKALAMEENPQTIKILADAYQRDGRDEEAAQLYAKATKLLSKKSGHQQKVKQPPHKAVM